ncbi:flagellar hook assembly protein [Methylopila jiangsuensis]|uniref:Basal-body rod modification protein FlgD n=1 Tax=Methylopila jiangsuensis TaxID=586230 RepID=A0A9W6JIU9_9HYPH|nr:flagellar hook capping FlgD N-terminal domain-containing protein [Methylopila jiangsuensis]MDR6284155.1 flagellar basal-body rod modification protein FlgD [Methylopila jiangsuensis]GLK76328.1 flagellar hook assembly protein [Methylopila jiangsuensis]
MAIDAASSAAATSATTATTTSAKTLASNFDTFLTLLTTQLQNQNPLDPLDTNQFTQQLVQFASVEQQLKTNDTLTALLSAAQSSGADAAISLVGKQVTASGDTSALSSGKATWSLNAPKDGVTATIEIRNSGGTLVATRQATLSYGDQEFAWDGKTTSGAQASDGLYSITVTAKDAAGSAVSVSSEVAGVVDGVDLSSGTAALTIGGLTVPMSAVKAVRAAPST